MYFGGSLVGKASTIHIWISPTPPLIFTEGQKCEIWRRLKHHSNFVQTLITWHLMYHAKIRKIIHISRGLLDFTQISYRRWSRDVWCTKVNGSKIKITEWLRISFKNAIIQARVSCRRSNLVKIIPEQSNRAQHATRKAMFKVIRSNPEIAITPARIVPLR